MSTVGTHTAPGYGNHGRGCGGTDNQRIPAGEEYAKASAIKEVLDLCWGSGAIGISLAKLCPKSQGHMQRHSGEAVKTARGNAAALGCRSVKFEEGDMFAPLAANLERKNSI